MRVATSTPPEPVVLRVRPGRIRSRMPVLSSGARRRAVQCLVQKLSTSAAASSSGRRKNHLLPLSAQCDETLLSPGESTWWSDPSSGERRRVKLSGFRTLMLDSSYRPIAVVKYATTTGRVPVFSGDMLLRNMKFLLQMTVIEFRNV